MNDLGLENEQEKEETKKQNEDNKELLDFLKESLDGKVKEVRVSDRLKSHPVCLSSGGEITLEMEKGLNRRRVATIPRTHVLRYHKICSSCKQSTQILCSK